MESSSRARTGSMVAGYYDEFFNPVDAEFLPDCGAGRQRARRSTREYTRASSESAMETARSSRSVSPDRGPPPERKSSTHGADIRRQGSGWDRVKSSVSVFLNRDYFTPNDSVPLIRVSESYSRLLPHSSDEGTDSELEEVTETIFGTQAKNLKDALQNNFKIRKMVTGIPRMEGHMRLPDRRTAYTDEKDTLYRGQCYLVELPVRLERSTRTLTRSAVIKAMEAERVHRVSEIRSLGTAVSTVWLDVQKELRKLASDAEEESNEDGIATLQSTEDHMELVRQQLVQEVHRKAVKAEEGEAQQWKQMFFKGVAKNKLPPDTMGAVASTSEHMGAVLQQLQEAFSCTEVEKQTHEEVVVERTQDLKDACLNELMRCLVTRKINIEVTIEMERQVKEFKRGRPTAIRKSQSKEGIGNLESAKQAIDGSVSKLFRKVSDRQAKRESRVVDRVAEFKCIVQEDLVRMVWRRRLKALCAHEKARRILEAEDPAYMDDPVRVNVMDHWVRVQAQMVVDKFMSKKPMKKTTIEEVLRGRGPGSPSPIRNALDRRLKSVRERLRRPAIYVCDEDDAFARERARERTRLRGTTAALQGSVTSLLSAASRHTQRKPSSSRSPSPSVRWSDAPDCEAVPRERRMSTSAVRRPSSTPSRKSSVSRSASHPMSVVGSPSGRSAGAGDSGRRRSSVTSSRRQSPSSSPSGRRRSSAQGTGRRPSSAHEPDRRRSHPISPPPGILKNGGTSDRRRQPAGRSRSAVRRSRPAGGDFKEVVAPRQLSPDLPLTETRQYRSRSEKTEQFRQERRGIAERKESERNQRRETRRKETAAKVRDQYRSHWTAHIRE